MMKTEEGKKAKREGIYSPSLKSPVLQILGNLLVSGERLSKAQKKKKSNLSKYTTSETPPLGDGNSEKTHGMLLSSTSRKRNWSPKGIIDATASKMSIHCSSYKERQVKIKICSTAFNILLMKKKIRRKNFDKVSHRGWSLFPTNAR